MALKIYSLVNFSRDAAAGFDDSGTVGFRRQPRLKLTNKNDSSQLFIQSTFSVHMNFFFHWSHTSISTNDRPVEWCYEEKSFR